MNKSSSVEKIFPKKSTKIELPYSQIQNGVSAEILTPPKEGNAEEIALPQNIIALYLGLCTNMHFVSENRHYKIPLYKGSLGIVPSQMPMQCCWDQISSFLYIYVEPWFLSRCSEEIYKETKVVEIIPQMQPLQDGLTKQLCLAIKDELEQKSSLAVISHRNK